MTFQIKSFTVCETLLLQLRNKSICLQSGACYFKRTLLQLQQCHRHVKKNLEWWRTSAKNPEW